MRLFRTLISLLAVVCPAFGQSASRWPGWNSYQVFMWSTGSSLNRLEWIDRLREMGVTGEQCTSCDATPFVQKQFGFYVENMVAELAYLHSRQAMYDADWNSYTTTRDPKYLLRKPSLDDPNFWGQIKPQVQQLVTRYGGQGPLMYELRDELSIGRFASPMDYCFDPNTLREFRVWLQGVYGSIEALNQEWETSFSSWDNVVPMTTYEVKDRERTALAAGRPENYAPWADHRAYMDISFNRALDRLRGYIREIDPTRPVGVEGTQMPSAWGGYDLWRMSQAVDWVEPYDIANSREIFRSFLPRGAPIISTIFGTDYPAIRRRLWWLLLHGDRGTLIWDDDAARCILKDQQGQPLTDRGRALGEIFADIRKVAPVMMPLRPIDDRIAVHYSQASIRAHWMFDSREDGNTWPRRFSSYEPVHSRFARARDGMIRVIEDLGLQYNFVSYEQIEGDELLRGGYRVLLLPQSVAMSAREASAIESFVRTGGTVIADNMTATMDEHLRRLAKGQLDGLFGIERSGVGWNSGPSGGLLPESRPGVSQLAGYESNITVVSGTSEKSTSGVPVLVENHAGAGRTVYLNLYLNEYGERRLQPPKGAGYLDAFARILKASGIEAAVKVLDAGSGTPAPGVEVWRYLDTDGEYVAVMRNPEFRASDLKSVGYPDNTALETPLRVRIVLPASGTLTNIRTGEAFQGATVETDLDPWSPIILKRAADPAQRQLTGRPSPPRRRN